MPCKMDGYCFDDDFGCIINSALRYSIRRHTYMPGVVVDFIRKYINIIDTKTIEVAIEDITQALDRDEVDEPEMWTKLKNDLVIRRAYLHERANIVEKINAQQSKKDDGK